MLRHPQLEELESRAMLALPNLVGIDFGTGPTTPTNWNFGIQGQISFTDLIDETGAQTAVDLTLSSSTGNTNSQPLIGTVPTHTPSLSGLDGTLTGAGGVTLTLSDLAPSLSYDVYIFGLTDSAGFGDSNQITITHDGAPITFTQHLDVTDDPLILDPPVEGLFVGELVVNNQNGSNDPLGSFAETVIAPASGEIVINVASPTGNFGLAGLAIQESNGPEIEVSGNGLTIPDGDATPSLADDTDVGFAQVFGGVTTKSFTIGNLGLASLNVSAISVSGTNASDFTISNDPASVAARSSGVFDVNFDPSGLGMRSATISIFSDDNNESPYTFAVQGTGVSAPVPEIDVQGNGLSIASGDFTPDPANGTRIPGIEVGAGTVTQVFTIENVGNADLNLASVEITGEDPNDFVLSGITAPTVIPAGGGTNSFTVEFTPLVEGLRRAIVEIGSDDEDEPLYRFRIEAFGLNPPLVGIDFGPGGSTPTNWTFGIQGNINFPNLIDETGSPTSIDLMLSSTPGNDNRNPSAATTPIHTDPVTGIEGPLTSINGYFTATGSITLTLSELNPNINYNIYIFGLSKFNNDTNEITITGSGSPITFTQTLIANELQINDHVSSNAPISSFAQKITPSSSGVITIQVDSPSGFFGLAGLALEKATEPEIEVLGGGLVIPIGDTTPSLGDDTDLGFAQVSGAVNSSTLTIANYGAKALNLSAINVTGTNPGDFSVPNAPTFVKPGFTTTFEILFDPQAAGLRTATISIENDDDDENPYEFDVRGIGTTTPIVEMDVQGNGLSIIDGDASPDLADGTDLGSVEVFLETGIQSFTIENAGNADLNISSIDLTGINADDFEITGITLPVVVRANRGTTTFTIEFTPGNTGLRRATIEINNDDPDENPYTFDIQGIGDKPALIGIDLHQSSAIPTNWNSLGPGQSGLTNLINENSRVTGIDLTVSPSIQFASNATVDAETIPTHLNSLADIGGTVLGEVFLTPMEYTFANLDPELKYDVYVFGLAGVAGDENRITIQGERTINFNQAQQPGTLHVNNHIGDDRPLPIFARTLAPNPSNGTIKITVELLPTGTPNARSSVAGLALQVATGTDFDYGDAPNSYRTINASNGPRHFITPDLYIGASPPDGDIDGFDDGTEDHPNSASDDDVEGTTPDDEDGLGVLPPLTVCDSTHSITVDVSNTTGSSATLTGWIDFDGNGVFNGDEDTSVVVPNGATSATLTWSGIGGSGPNIVGGDTFMRLRLATDDSEITSATGVASSGEVEDHALTITAPACVSVSTSPTSVDEDDTGNLIYTFSRTGPTTDELTIDFHVGGSAALTTDYAVSGANTFSATTGSLTFPIGQSTVDVTVDPEIDDLVELNETVVLTVVDGTDYLAIAPASATGTISDDDEARLSINDRAVSEGDTGQTSVTFTVTLDAPVDAGFTVNYDTADDVATTLDNDYVPNLGSTLSFSGNAGETRELTVQVSGDEKVERDETFRVILSNIQAGGRNVTFLDSEGEGQIDNDDEAVVTIQGVTQDEGSGGTTDFNFEVSVDKEVDGGFGVNFNVIDGTATDVDDFDVITLAPVAFTGDTSEIKNITVRVGADSKVEAEEVFAVALTSISDLLPGLNPAAFTINTVPVLGIIGNDDTSTLTIEGVSQNEGTGGTTDFDFDVMLNNPVQGGLTVAFAVHDGTATDADDFDVATLSPLNFSGASANEVQTITVRLDADDKVEFDEDFTVTLGTVTTLGAGVGVENISTAGTPAIGEVANDDTVAISGQIFEDKDGDGTDDGGTDPSLDGITVELFRDGGDGVFGSDGSGSDAGTGLNGDDDISITSQLTAGGGLFSFPGNDAGRFFVRDLPGANTVITTSDFQVADTSERTIDVTGITFGNAILGSIHSFSFEDINGNGIYEPGTDLIQVGTQFTLSGKDALGNDVNLINLSDANGEVSFEDLVTSVAGQAFGTGYTLTETIPLGFSNSTPTTFSSDLFSRKELVAFNGQAMLLPTDPQVEVLVGDPLKFGVFDALDFGDAPATYGTSTASHVAIGPRLGAFRDFEPPTIGAQISADATGDDLLDGNDDEDATSPPTFTENVSTMISIDVQNVSGSANVKGWFDWNGNDIFDDPSELAVDEMVASSGVIMVSVMAPTGTLASNLDRKTFARFRVSSDAGLTPTNVAVNGEIEDYEIAIGVPDLQLDKNNDVGGNAVFGQPWTWTSGIANTGDGDALFNSGDLIYEDLLPADLNLGAVSVSNQIGVGGSGTIDCGILGGDLACTASGGSVIVATGGSFDIGVVVTPQEVATFTNPRVPSGASVDPNNVVPEDDENNNEDTDQVTVRRADTTTTVVSDTPDPSKTGQVVSIVFDVSVDAPGAGMPTGTVTVTDGVDRCTGTIIAGTGSCDITLNTPLERILTATYNGDDHFNASVSVDEPHFVGLSLTGGPLKVGSRILEIVNGAPGGIAVIVQGTQPGNAALLVQGVVLQTAFADPAVIAFSSFALDETTQFVLNVPESLAGTDVQLQAFQLQPYAEQSQPTTFHVNAAPELEIPDQNILPTDVLNLVDPGTDVDGDPLGYTADLFTADLQLAYDLDQSYLLYVSQNDIDNDYFFNYYGWGEKYIRSSWGYTFMIFESGDLYLWGWPWPVATLDPAYFDHPELLHDALLPSEVAGPGDVAINVVGDTITVDPVDTFTGTAIVHATADDGCETDDDLFFVEIEAAPPLLAENGERKNTENTSRDTNAPTVKQPVAEVTLADLNETIGTALEIYEGAGLTANQLDQLSQVEFAVAELDGARLGQASGDQMVIDVDAAGYGWFVDVTPLENEEFVAVTNRGLAAFGESAAAGQMDLLTVVLHELGHILGLDDLDSHLDVDDLMYGKLAAGLRKLPI